MPSEGEIDAAIRVDEVGWGFPKWGPAVDALALDAGPSARRAATANDTGETLVAKRAHEKALDGKSPVDKAELRRKLTQVK